jgi:hypothetical protein
MAIRQQQILARLAREFHVPEEHLRGRMAELRRGGRRPRTVDNPQEGARPAAQIKLPAWERELLVLALTSADAFDKLAAQIDPTDVEHPLARDIYQSCLAMDRAGANVEFGSLLLRYDDVRVKSLLIHLDEEACAKEHSDVSQRIGDLVREVRNREREAQVQSHRSRLLKGNLSQEQEVEALSSLFAQLKSRQAGSAPTDG